MLNINKIVNKSSILKMYVSLFKRKKIKEGKQYIDEVFEKKFVSIENEEIKEKDILYKMFCEYNMIKPQEASTIATQFINAKIRLTKKNYEKIPVNEPILLCNVKDDLKRVKMMIEYHRKIGVNYFAIIDNNSTDGTYEYLVEQKIDLFETDEVYNSRKRAGWMMKRSARSATFLIRCVW